MSWWIKFGCVLTGWSSKILSQCSEASKTQLNKYTSAMLILIVIWSITGFCFAQRYIGLPVWGCLTVSLIFVTIVIMIERQIILTQEKSLKLLVFRGVIAVVMAFVGSTIFDQTMFGKDIDKQMANTIEMQVADLAQKRGGIIDSKLASVGKEKDSLNKINAMLQTDINAHPWIVQTSVTTNRQQVVLDGKLETVSNPSVTTCQVANPKQEVIASNNEKIKQLTEQEKEWTRKKLTVEEDTRSECKSNIGFLEELEAMWTIISTRKLAGLFYLVFFILLMSMEMFVVVSKMGDRECDYEVAIKGSQKLRIAQFNLAYSKVQTYNTSGVYK